MIGVFVGESAEAQWRMTNKALLRGVVALEVHAR